MKDTERQPKTVLLEARYLNEPISAQAYIKEIFAFPPHYGMNLDAFYDCLTEQGDVKVIFRIRETEPAMEGYAGKVYRVLKDAVQNTPGLELTEETVPNADPVPGAYQLIALDMDGTVLNTKKQIDPRTQDAIHRALAAGKEVVFCSGRCYAEMRDILKDYPDMNYMIGESGALIYDLKNQRVISCTTIPQELINTIREAIDGRDIMPVVFSDGELYAAESQVYRLSYYQMAPYAEAIPKLATIVDDVFEAVDKLDSGYEKLNLFHSSVPERTKTRSVLEKLSIPSKVEVINSEISSLECSALHTHKGNGILKLAEVLGIPREQTVMVGDAGNDVPGLRCAGLAVAMGNAHDFVKELSDVVVADNDHDGCAEAIERYLLGETNE